MDARQRRGSGGMQSPTVSPQSDNNGNRGFGNRSYGYTRRGIRGNFVPPIRSKEGSAGNTTSRIARPAGKGDDALDDSTKRWLVKYSLFSMENYIKYATLLCSHDYHTNEAFLSGASNVKTCYFFLFYDIIVFHVFDLFVIFCSLDMLCGPDGELPEKLRNLEPRLIEHISNEIMDQDPNVRWEDIGIYR